MTINIASGYEQEQHLQNNLAAVEADLVIQIESLKTKFDTVVVSNSLIVLLDHDYNEARFLQQLHYWSYSEYGVVIDGIRWIYKSAKEWLNEALIGLTEWKLRKAIASLLEKNLIRKEKLYTKHHQQEYKSPWWNPKNQTCYYSINYEELQKLIEQAESTENVRFENSTKLSIEETKETKVGELSRNKTKNTNHKKLTNKQDKRASQPASPPEAKASLACDRNLNEPKEFAAAALSKSAKEAEENQKGKLPHSAELICEAVSFRTASAGQKKVESELNKSNTGKETNIAQVDYIVNTHRASDKNWKNLISLLDSTGIPINKTVTSLLKLYSKEKVASAIALLKARKREKYIPNPSGYFVSALKGDWAGQNLISDESDRTEEIDKAAVFRHWYDLARELGYCSGTEVREGEQWVCLTGTWEQWSAAIKRGYSLEYLKKIIKRNNRN